VTEARLLSEPKVVDVGGMRLRLQQPGPRQVEVHELPTGMWVANAYCFDHAEGPLLRLNFQLRDWVGATERDSNGWEIRAVIRQEARQLYAHLLGEFAMGLTDFSVYRIGSHSKIYRVYCDDGAGLAAVCQLTTAASAAVMWCGQWAGDSWAPAILRQARAIITPPKRRRR
jgi:hypothetical protein